MHAMISLYRDTLAGEYTVFRYPEPIREATKRIPLDSCQEDKAREALIKAVEGISGGANTVLFDDAGYPSVMVRIPMMRRCDLIDGCTDLSPHPAFVFGGKTLPKIHVSKYLNSVRDGVAVSLPMQCPEKIHRYDNAVTMAKAKGAGWQLMPCQLLTAIALSCRRAGRYPSGGNIMGHDYLHPEQQGVIASEGMVLTGSGPACWTHTGGYEGIWDLNGNLNEWASGFRLMNGQVQFIPTDDLYARRDCSSASPLWKALDADGRYTAADGTTTLYYDAPENGVRLTTQLKAPGHGGCAFSDVTVDTGVHENALLHLLGLCPQPACPVEGVEGWRRIDTTGETMPLCGGAYRVEDHGGVFFMGTKPRHADYHLAGMRSVFIDINQAY